MKQRKGIVFSLISGGMELCWMYGWVSFLMTAIIGFPVSFLGLTGTFALAAVLTAISSGKGWRVIQIGGLHIAGFAVAALGIMRSVYYPTYRLLDGEWLRTFFHQSRTPLAWLILTLIIVCIIVFWIGGVTLVRRARTYHTVCARFDIGLAAFFCLFLAKLVLLSKGGIKVADPWSPTLIFPFFLFGLFAIAMTKVENRAKKTFLPGYRGIGIIVTFLAIVLLTAVTVMLFFLPLLTAAANTGYDILKGGAGFILPFVERVLRFAFMGRGVREDPPDSSPKSKEWDFSSSTDSPWMQFIETVMKWGIEGLAALLLIVGCGIVLFFLIRWLLSRSKHIEKEIAETYRIAPWIARIWSVLIFFWRKIQLAVRGYRTASEFYAILTAWGRHTGLSCLMYETPLEFGARLEQSFPRLTSEIRVIVNAFNNEFYGGVGISGEAIQEARGALRSLHSPRHWFKRIKIRFTNTGDREPV